MAKQCSYCGRSHDESAFYVKNKKTGALFSWCKECHSIRSKKLYEKNLEANRKRMREKARERYHKDVSASRAKRMENYYSDLERSRERGRFYQANRLARLTGLTPEQRKREAEQFREARQKKKQVIDEFNCLCRKQKSILCSLREKVFSHCETKESRDMVWQFWQRGNEARIGATSYLRSLLVSNGRDTACSSNNIDSLKIAQSNTCLCCGLAEPSVKLVVDSLDGQSDSILSVQLLCESCKSEIDS